MARAVASDAEAIAAIARAEEGAQRDRALALRMSGLTADPAIQQQRHNVVQQPYNPMQRQAPQASSSGFASVSRPGPSDQVRQQNLPDCVSCMEKVKGGVNQHIKVACNHTYCQTCIQQLFKQACKDETLFPPRCCRQEIDPNSVRLLLGEREYEQFAAKAIELGTKDRLYCIESGCGTFIGAAIPVTAEVKDSASTRALRRDCPRCGRAHCAACKRAAHGNNKVCRRDQDEASQAVLDLAKRAGWKRCNSCSNVVELKEGCNHITCVCSNEFCFVCMAKWPHPSQSTTCLNGCELYSEAMLQAQAVHQVRGRGEGYDQPVRQAVAQAREQILENHACYHDTGFRYRHGAGNCEHCDMHMPAYLFACRACDLTMCNTCRRNRLR